MTTHWEIPMPEGRPSYPATLTFDAPEKVANWRPLVQWFLVIPQVFVLYVLGLVSEVVAIISWFVILFTGQLPDGLANLQALFLRYSLRTYTYMFFLRAEYPPFTFETTPADPGSDPRVRVDVLPERAGRNRLTVGFRIILAIPQLVVIAVLWFAAGVVTLIAFFAVLFTGRWPAGMRDFVTNVFGWWLRVEAYLLLLTDQYPPFAFV
jgi:hypothetical protein